MIQETVILDSPLLIQYHAWVRTQSCHIRGVCFEWLLNLMIHQRSVLCAFSELLPGNSVVMTDECHTGSDVVCVGDCLTSSRAQSLLICD